MNWKSYKQRKKFRNLVYAANIINNFYRGYKARKLKRKLKFVRKIFFSSLDNAWLEIKFGIETEAIIVI